MIQLLLVRYVKRLVVLLLFAVGLIPALVHAQTSSEVTLGLQWLTTQIQPTGSLATEAQSIALPFQDRSEVMRTLQRLSSVPSTLTDAIASEPEDNTEYLSRRVLALTAAGRDTAAPAAALMANRNLDGGYGGAPGYASDPLDTAWALLALKALSSQDNQTVSGAINFLAQSKQGDGGWGVAAQTRTFVTATVLLSANEWKNTFSVGAITTSARNWLLSQTSVGVFGTALDNAMGLLSLLTQTADTTVLQPLVSTLKAQQLADGSWADDPFVTALAVRALWLAGQPVVSPTTGDVSGSVVDAQTKTAIAGATIQLMENPALATATDANGSYMLSGVVPGQYTLQVSKFGYAVKQVVIQISAGQVTNVGAIDLSVSSLNASLSGVVKNTFGGVIQDAMVSVGTATASTDANGRYSLSGLSPGPAVIAVVKSSYQTATTNVDLTAGTSYSFSPTLYASGSTPSVTSLRGKIGDAVTNVAIANAQVAVGQATATTGADGSFSLTNLTAGSFSLTIAAGGYQGVTATGVLASGVNDVGSIAIGKLPTTSTLSGVVTDATTGAPIAGVALTVQGTSLSAITSSSGAYQLTGITSPNFNLLVTANGYVSSKLGVTLPQVGTSTLNVQLVTVQSGGIVFNEVKPGNPTYAPTEELEVEIGIQNTTTSAASLTVDAQVLDAQGNVAMELKGNANGLGQNPPNLPITFAAGSDTDFEIKKMMNRQAAGTYTVIARGYDANGVVVVEGTTQFSVSAEAYLAGGVILDPPLAQAGTNMPVRISGQFGNFGNQPMPAGALDLAVTLNTPDTSVNTLPQTSVTPLTTGALLNNPRGLVKDAAGNLYTVNNTFYDGKIVMIDPQGTQSIYATIPSAKLPSLVGLTIDSQGALWVANYNGRIWQVTSQGIASEIVLTSLDTVTGIDNDGAGSLIITGSKNGESRLARRTVQGAESILWANGLNNPVGIVKDSQGNLVVSNAGDNTLVKIAPTGQILPFVSGLNHPIGLTGDGAGNLYVANNGDGTIVRVAPDGTKTTYATGLSSPGDMKADLNGVLYVSAQTDNAIYRVQTNGSVELFAKGLANRPQGMKYDANGNLYIANDDGTLRMQDTSGQASVLFTGLSSPRGLDVSPTGDLYIANYGSNAITKYSAGVKTSLTPGLANPYGVAIDGAGNLNVTERGVNRITQLDASGSIVRRIETLVYQPSMTRVAPDGRTYVLNSGFITVVENGVPRIFFRDFGPNSIGVDPLNGGLVAQRGNDLYRISADGVASKIKTLTASTGNSGVAVDAAGDLVVADYYAKTINKVDSNGTIAPFASLPSYPRAVTADFAGHIYVLMDTNKILKLADDGTNMVVFSTTEYAYNMSMASDGRLLIWTNYSKLYAIDPATGTATVLKTGYLPTGVAVDASNQIWSVTSSDNDLVTYNSSGAEVGRVSGFAFPWDIVWTGAELRFVDNNNRLFRMAPDGYPIRMGNFNAYYLTQRGADTYGTSSNAIYKWNGTGAQYATSLTGTSSLAGIAGKTDGSMTVGDNTTSRVITFNAGDNIVSDYAGIVGPQGLAFDAQGRLYVANYGGQTIARFDVGSKMPVTFAHSYSPLYLAFDPSGNLWVSHPSSVEKITSQAVSSTVSYVNGLQGLLVDESGVYGVQPSSSLLRKFNGQSWPVLAAGLSIPEGVRVGSDGAIYVANSGNNTVTKFADGRLDAIAGDLTSSHAVALASDGTIYVTGNSGTVSQIGMDGTVLALNFASLLKSQTLYGVVQAANGNIVVESYNGKNSALYQVSVTQTAGPPPAGTVVYHTQAAFAGLDVGEAMATIDFGNWVPPYGGEYSVQVSYANVPGVVQNFLHVGPYANGTLTTSTPTVAPGDQTVSLNLNLTGADFTSISRVETGLVRKLVSIARPNGMVGDKAGNIWFTDYTSLKKTTPDGVTTTVVSNISPVFGLAVDSHEQFYLPVKVSGGYNLIQVKTDGTVTTMVNLGAIAANGVAVNSADEVLIGQSDKLMKFSPVTKTLSVVSTLGIPQPRGIAVDGRDNVYVQNEGNFVSMIKPDGSATTIFSLGDGIKDPTFEGDGYPNIAADCADNFYIAASNWSKINQNGEEHVLAQVIPRTGSVSALFNGLQISSNLQDIDYLAYDRFGSRILMWTDGINEIWQVPVTCGAIGMEAHLVSKPGQMLKGFSKAPSAAITQADGRTEYVWSLRDVTTQGVNIGFDTLLSGMRLGETRNAIDSGYLLFQNTFSSNNVTVPFAIPSIQATNLVNAAVTTDKVEYLANNTAQIATSLMNANATTVAGDLSVDVYDMAGVSVGNVTRQNVALNAGQALTVNGAFGIGAIVPGTYIVKATLSTAGVEQTSSQTTFKVLANRSQAAASSSLSVDKLQYAPSDRVNIVSRATDQSANVILEHLLLNVRVTDSTNNVLATKVYQIPQLLPGLSVSFTTPYALQTAAPGTYQVVQTLTDANGQVYDTHTVTFVVGATADSGFGLVGAIAAAAKKVTIGDALAFSFTATDSGNSALTNLPLTVSVVDPATQTVVATFPYTQTLTVGTPFNGGVSWTATGQPGTTYVAVLSATVGGKTLTLGQDTFTLMASPIKLGIQQATTNTSRVLVLVSCQDDEHDASDDHGNDDGHDTSDGHEHDDGHDSSDGHDQPSLCETQRMQIIDQTLTTLGVMHTITTNASTFKQNLRSGLYNTYWISGKQDKLEGDLITEVGEAAYGGSGLTFDGVHDQRNKAFDAMAGISYRGKIGETDLPVNIAGPDFAAAQLASSGRGLKLELDGGTQEAAFAGTHPTSNGPALVMHDYGRGHAVLFAFDLVTSLQAQASWQAVLSDALHDVLPLQTTSLAPGSLFSTKTSIVNQAQAVNLSVDSVLPQGAAPLGSTPTGIFNANANTMNWAFALREAQSTDLLLTIRVPAVAGSYTLQTQVSTVAGGAATVYGNPLSQTLMVTSATQTASDVQQMLSALTLTKKSDRKVRDNALNLVQAASSDLNQGTASSYDAAVNALIQAVNAVLSLPVDTTAIRHGLDALLQEAEWRWWQAAAQ